MGCPLCQPMAAPNGTVLTEVKRWLATHGQPRPPREPSDQPGSSETIVSCSPLDGKVLALEYIPTPYGYGSGAAPSPFSCSPHRMPFAAWSVTNWRLMERD